MKGKVFRTFCLSILSFVALLTGLLLVNVRSVHAETTPVVTTDLSKTIDETFPDADTNSAAAVVKAAMLDHQNYHTEGYGISGDSTLAEVQAEYPAITIDQPLTSYEPLTRITPVLHELSLTHQTSQIEASLPAIMSTLLATRPDKYKNVNSLDLSNDQLTNADLTTLLSAAEHVHSTTVLSNLYLNQNDISDFSPWMDYKNAQGATSPIGNLYAPSSTSSDAPLLTDVVLNGTTAKIPFTKFDELTTPFSPDLIGDPFSRQGQIAFKVFNSPDFFDDPTNFIPNGALGAGKVIPLTTYRDQYRDFPTTLDFRQTDRIDAQSNTYYQPLPQKQIDSVSAYFPAQTYTILPPNDPDYLTITNVPAHSTALHLRVLVCPFKTVTYIQNYTIKLYPAPKTAVPTNNLGSSSNTSSSSNTVVSQADKAKPENKIVYATKKIGLYNSPTFTNKARIHWYTKAKRTNRPMFKVTGYARSKNGLLRYKVKDVTPNAKTNGQTGYITAKDSFVSHAYYQTQTKKIKVLRGLNSYKTKALTGKKLHYRKNQVIRVKKLVTHNLTTRYQLPNDRYVSANKRLVMQVK
ncbi:DUF5776 domain-containing protein [Levilactobacillus lanxiensis]|uniref:DUF5776 domain-containing protein n=1 Tax=Levilactobacillus lanxiensis TaxID=2799568 RepID=A0ABW4D300_9LACO|nr:DUF5776 domain-containing protein [Levilactobacillus lanxiensis]